MGGDLNLKKSWHPSLMSNQKKVWESEQAALEERKKIDQIRKEREEERQIQELQELQEAAGGKKRQARVDWMYNQSSSSGQVGTSEENEAFLLGKRRVDTLLQGKEKEALQKITAQTSQAPMQSLNATKDAASKIRDDPLLAIKKQEQAAYEAMMNDPVKRRMLLRAAGQEEHPEPDRKRRKHHHSSSNRHRDRDRDSERYSRTRSSRDDSREKRDRHRRRSFRDRSTSTPRSMSPDPRSRRRSPVAQHRRSRSRSRDGRDRSRSPYRERNTGRRLQKARSWHNTRRNSSSRSRSPPKRRDNDEDRSARLAAMQQDASDLDTQRQHRLNELADRDQKAAEIDDRARARNAKYGGRADFVNGFHKRAGDQTLSERIGQKRYTERGEED